MHASSRALLRPSALAASRRLLATSSKATPAKTAPLAVAADPHHTHSHDEITASLSHGERAWCDVYGVDYAKMLQEAHDESPLALYATPATAATSSASSPVPQPSQDIWSVVFGTHQ